MARRRKRAKAVSPADAFAWWRAGADLGRLAVEANAVIAYRTFGMAGVLPLPPGEHGRMVAEKAAAFPRAAAAMSGAALAGKGMEAMVSAGVKPLGRVTGANVRRLSGGKSCKRKTRR